LWGDKFGRIAFQSVACVYLLASLLRFLHGVRCSELTCFAFDPANGFVLLLAACLLSLSHRVCDEAVV
jgi:hypothetical protein